MKQLSEMYISLEMDRPIDSSKHYISPGGYMMNGKCFDFNSSKGTVWVEDPTIVDFQLKDFDDSLGETDEEIVITKADIAKGFDEFYVYTGENDEPEINVKSVKEIVFSLYDPEKDWIEEINASEEILASANAALCSG